MNRVRQRRRETRLIVDAELLFGDEGGLQPQARAVLAAVGPALAAVVGSPLAADRAAELARGAGRPVAHAPRIDSGLFEAVAAPASGSTTARTIYMTRRPERVAAARSMEPPTLPIAIAGVASAADRQALDDAGADWVYDRPFDAAAAVVTRKRPESVSVVLLAVDEQPTIARAVGDARQFGRLFFADHEVIVVDDGSRDATAARARACDRGDVRLIRHRRNMGMGASLRDGFAAATGDYVVPLPADRQVRTQALIPFVPLVTPERAVHGVYLQPHGRGARPLLSWGLRALVRHVGECRVDFAGSYMFHRSWLSRIDQRALTADSFFYSFQLLEQLRRAGCGFAEPVVVEPFAREAGRSRVARPGRMARIAVELVRQRLVRYRRVASSR